MPACMGRWIWPVTCGNGLAIGTAMAITMFHQAATHQAQEPERIKGLAVTVGMTVFPWCSFVTTVPQPIRIGSLGSDALRSHEGDLRAYGF